MDSGPRFDGDSSAEGAIRPGARFGDVSLLRQIGRGGQGVVYEARQESVGRKVAVKILPRELAFTPEQVERFRREAEAAGRLSHANIVAVYELFEAAGHRFIVQELVTGGSLSEGVAARKLASHRTDVNHCAWAATVCRQLAEGLQHAHENQVVHRDMKPANVLLTENGTPKITDFGLAKLQDVHGLSITGAIFGTPSFMSPEQVQGKSGIDHRTDVYSLGAVLYQLLTNELPFHAENVQGLFVDILTRAPKAPRRLQPGVSADLEAVCLKALEKSPDSRYATAGEFGADLERYLAGESTVARPVGPLGQVLRWLRRLASSTLAVVALLVPTAWFALDNLLRSQARTQPSLHAVRLGWAAVATLLLAWPLSLLGVRLARGRGWGRVPALAVVLLLGGLAANMIWEQRTVQLHLTDRTRLARTLNLEAVGATRADVADLEEYAARWDGRLEAQDELLLARGFLKRSRPTRAAEWISRPAAAATDGPEYYVLLWAVDDALGQDAPAAAAQQRYVERARAGIDWAVLAGTGSVLSDMKRYADARDILKLAGVQPRADRDQLNLQLAVVSKELCGWNDMADYLRDFAKWHPDDPDAEVLAFDLALAQEDWPTAEGVLAALEARSDVTVLLRVAKRHQWLLQRASLDEAAAHVQSAYEGAGDDRVLREWCAGIAIEMGKSYDLKASGDAATQWFQRSADWSAALANAPESAAAAHTLRSAALSRLAPHIPERRQELEAQAVEEARAAVALDANYWQAHFNLGYALRRGSLLSSGNQEDAIPLAELQAYVEPMRRALQCNGLNGQALNDTAHSLGLVYKQNRERAILDEAFEDAHRAVRRFEPREQGACKPSADERSYLSSAHDTVRELDELAGDLRGALAEAQVALSVLQPGDARYDKRVATIARLKAALGE